MKVLINTLKATAGILLVFGLVAFTSPTITANPCDGCGCTSNTCTRDDGKTVVDIAVQAGSFNTLVAAVKAAGLVDTLKGKGPFTVFAPTDEAFARIPKADLANLLKPENKAQLISILTYHVVPSKVMADEVVELSTAKTVNGQKVDIEITKGRVFVDNAQVVQTDISASNGVIHVIDRVIMPDSRKDIVDTAVSAGTFNTLVAAVQAAGLVDTLKGDGPFTVFAPSDEAFGKLPKDTLASLLRPENKAKLTAILTNHVVAGELMAEKVIGSNSASTVGGQSVDFEVRGGNVYVDQAKVVQADISAKNGVIHVIDTVLIPR